MIEQPLAVVIVAVLTGLAGYFGIQQWRTIRRLKQSENLHPEDRRYHRRHAGRVFTWCVLMVIVAGLVGGWYVLGLGRSEAGLGRVAPRAVHNTEHSLTARQHE